MGRHRHNPMFANRKRKNKVIRAIESEKNSNQALEKEKSNGEIKTLQVAKKKKAQRKSKSKEKQERWKK